MTKKTSNKKGSNFMNHGQSKKLENMTTRVILRMKTRKAPMSIINSLSCSMKLYALYKTRRQYPNRGYYSTANLL